ncbi:MAG: M43 family zinc metalloprotease [Bacteroidota bacterium]
MHPSSIIITILTLFGLLSSCTPKPATYGTVATPQMERMPVEGDILRTVKRYDASLYIPDTNHLEHMPLRQVNVCFHFMNTADTLYRYNGAEGVKYAEQLVNYANKDLSENAESWLQPTGQEVPKLPTRYYLRLVNKAGTEEPAVYFHYDEELYDYVFSGRNRNIGDRSVITKYGVDIDEVLNIFVMAPPRDSLSSPTFKADALTGVFLGKAIKVAGFHPRHRPAWEHRGNINHEIGHALGLHHAWLKHDGCEDTRAHANRCWARSQSAYCDTMTSNNIMDYSALQNAWTPCQIGRIHARMGDLDSKQRGWLGRIWCKSRAREEILIDDTIVWEGNRDLTKSIRIKAGGRLVINARTHLARDAKIIVDPGGQLELGPRAWLHNDCGEAWGGIESGTQGRLKGSVVISEGARLENLSS